MHQCTISMLCHTPLAQKWNHLMQNFYSGFKTQNILLNGTDGVRFLCFLFFSLHFVYVCRLHISQLIHFFFIYYFFFSIEMNEIFQRSFIRWKEREYNNSFHMYWNNRNCVPCALQIIMILNVTHFFFLL